MIVYDDRYLIHVNWLGHVESPDRLRAIVSKLKEEGLWEDVVHPEPLDARLLSLVHKESYIAYVRDMEEGLVDQETVISKGLYEIALLAAGGALLAGQRAVEEGKPWIALIRPPGHHAGPDYGGGFCFFNNVALTAATLLKKLSRIAILDFDAHHGNGTNDIFASDGRVLYVSTHQWPLYPGTGPAESVGEGKGEGKLVNIPFPPRTGDSSYLAAYDEIAAPILNQFKPEVILVSLGVDAHYRDPIASLTLSSPGYVELVDKATKSAEKLCSSRIAIILEGGYNIQALGEVFAGICASLKGRRINYKLTEVSDKNVLGRRVIDRAKSIHRKYWNL